MAETKHEDTCALHAILESQRMNDSKALHDEISVVGKNVSSILTLLRGAIDSGGGGLVGEVRHHGQRIKALEKRAEESRDTTRQIAVRFVVWLVTAGIGGGIVLLSKHL